MNTRSQYQKPWDAEGTGPSSDKIRVGILSRSFSFAPWQSALIRRLSDESNLNVSLVKPLGYLTSRPTKPFSLYPRLTDRAEINTLFRLFSAKLARRKIPYRLLDARRLHGIDLAEELDIRVTSIPSIEDQESVRSAPPFDVLIDCDWCYQSDVLQQYASRGIWRIETDLDKATALSPLGFAEFCCDQPLCGIRIQAEDKTGQTVIAQGRYAAYPWSWNLNALILAHKFAPLLIDALMSIDAPLAQTDRKPADTTPQKRNYSYRFSGIREISTLLSTAMNLVRKVVDTALFEDHWSLLILDRSQTNDEVARIVSYNPPRHSFWADPFLAHYQEKVAIFFEEYPHATKKGIISYCELTDENCSKTEFSPQAHPVLKQPYHLSYPFLQEHEGTLYMIPEASKSDAVQIWRCDDFPHKWTKQGDLLKGVNAADSSLLFWNKRWWLFTNIDRSGFNDHRDELHIYYSDNLLKGDWVAHPLNPVVVDAQIARMAGGFLYDSSGQPIRCCQVQGARYGMSVSYARIIHLDESRYREELVERPAYLEFLAPHRHHHVAAKAHFVAADICGRRLKIGRHLGL